MLEKQFNSAQKYIFVLFIMTLIFYGFSLPFSIQSPHFSPSNDFSNHAHYMASFVESFKSGQIIPRTIANTSELSDGTSNIDNIPTFQYYGFFEGLAGLPFHLLGFNYATAAILSSILIRFLGLIILFETCLLMGASPLTSLLACFSLLISPYSLTIYYGRGALAETFAQSLLILIPYGFVLVSSEKIYQGIIAIALGFFLLSICHNIFFLYGLVFFTVLVTFSFKPKVIITSICGALLGIMMSAWQWLPAQKTIKDTVIFGHLLTWNLNLHAKAVGLHSASLNGALGIPHPWQPEGFSHSLPLYHTLGWWTLPLIFLSLRSIYDKNKADFVFPFFMCFIVFFAMTFWPINRSIFYFFLPEIFSVVQDTSRLIGFISLLGALALAIVIPKISSRFFLILATLMLASQIPVLNCYIHLVSKQEWTNNQVIGSPINYYYATPKVENSPKQYMRNEEGFQIKRSDGTLNQNNSFYISPEQKQFFIQLNGLVSDPHQSIKLSIASLSQDPTRNDSFQEKVISKAEVIQADFSKIFQLRTLSPSGWYKIIATPYKPNEQLSAITLTHLSIASVDWDNFISANEMKLAKHPLGYSRFYRVKKDRIEAFKPDNEGFYFLELPSAYSKLFTVKQDGKKLDYFPDFNHQILIKTKDLQNPIKVSYRLDYTSFMLTLIGLLIFTRIFILQNRKEPNSLWPLKMMSH